jgi:hypothetical protein
MRKPSVSLPAMELWPVDDFRKPPGVECGSVRPETLGSLNLGLVCGERDRALGDDTADAYSWSVAQAVGRPTPL